MKIVGSRSVFFSVGTIVTLVFLVGALGVGWASDVKTLVSDTRKEIRKAERDMFGGKKEKAVASLPTIKEKLIKIKEADPNNPGLKTLEKKYTKLVKDLERRTGRDLGGGSLTTAGTSTQPGLPPKPESKAMPEKPETAKAHGSPGAKTRETDTLLQQTAPADGKKPLGEVKMPHDAKRPISNAERDLTRIDGHLEKMSNPKFNKDQLLKNMQAALDRARKSLEEARAKGVKKGVSSHPKFDEVEVKIQEAERKIAEAKKNYEKSQATLASQSVEVKTDVKKLIEEYNRLQPLFSRATGTVIHYNDYKTVSDLWEAIENFEKNDVGPLKLELNAFGTKYGTTRDAIDQKAETMGYSDPYHRASFPYTELLKGIENVKKTREVMADDILRKAEERKQVTSKGIHDFSHMKQCLKAKEWGQLAAKFDHENGRVKAFNAGIDAWIAEEKKALNAKIDKATLPSQAGDAPRDAKELAEVAKDFLQKEEDARAAKGKEFGKVAVVVVTGSWRLFKKNLLGEPIQYNLPIATAVQIDSEKDQNLMRVYHGTMLTEEMKGVKKAPPFIGATVGDSYYIRPSAVK